MRWLPLLMFAATAALGAGCNKTVYRAYESHYCSSTDDDDPYHECAKSSDLVCINTYKQAYPQPDGKPPKVVDMWLCRIGCDPAKAAATCMADEVCCPGAIYGKTYGFMHGCVQASYCASLDPTTPVRDGGVRDGGDAGDAGDGGGADVRSDAPVDVPIEASAPDAPPAADAGGDAGDAGDAADGI